MKKDDILDAAVFIVAAVVTAVSVSVTIGLVYNAWKALAG